MVLISVVIVAVALSVIPTQAAAIPREFDVLRTQELFARARAEVHVPSPGHSSSQISDSIATGSQGNSATGPQGGSATGSKGSSGLGAEQESSVNAQNSPGLSLEKSESFNSPGRSLEKSESFNSPGRSLEKSESFNTPIRIERNPRVHGATFAMRMFASTAGTNSDSSSDHDVVGPPLAAFKENGNHAHDVNNGLADPTARTTNTRYFLRSSQKGQRT